jgi:hypothetical protein
VHSGCLYIVLLYVPQCQTFEPLKLGTSHSANEVIGSMNNFNPPSGPPPPNGTFHYGNQYRGAPKYQPIVLIPYGSRSMSPNPHPEVAGGHNPVCPMTIMPPPGIHVTPNVNGPTYNNHNFNKVVSTSYPQYWKPPKINPYYPFLNPP